MTVRVTTRMLAAYDRLVKGGLIEKGAAAAVGNFCQESGENLDSTMYRAHPDASGGVAQALKSGGIAEWLGDRKLAYIAFSEAAERAQGLAAGTLLNDLESQCDFVMHEIETNASYADLFHQLTTDTGRSVATLTANFMRIYERPAEATANLDNRIAHAEALYDRAQTIKAATAQASIPEGVGPTIPSLPSVPSASAPAVPPLSTQPTAETTNLELAILDGLNRIVAQYDARIADDQKRRAFFDKQRQEFSSLLPPNMATIQQIPSPQAPFAPQSTLKPKVNPMQNVLGANWKTTVSGIIAAASAGIGNAYPQYQWLTSWLTPIALGALGLSAKDGNVTGGSVPQTVEAQSRSASAPVK